MSFLDKPVHIGKAKLKYVLDSQSEVTTMCVTIKFDSCYMDCDSETFIIRTPLGPQ